MSVEIDIPEEAVLISRTDTKGIITYASPDFQMISGYTEEELLKKPHNIVRHPDMPSAVFKEMWSVIKRGHVWTGLVKNKSKNGNFYWVDATITPVKEFNNVIGYVSVRKKPSRHDIARAESLYVLMRNSDKKGFFDSLFKKLDFSISRLTLSLVTTILISVIINLIGLFILNSLNLSLYFITSFGVVLFSIILSESYTGNRIYKISSILEQFSSGEFNLNKYKFDTSKQDGEYNSIVLGLKTLILSFGGILFLVKKTSSDQIVYSEKLQVLSSSYNKLSSEQAKTTEVQSNAIAELSSSMTEISDTIILQSDNLEVINKNINDINNSMTLTAQFLEELSSLNQKSIDKYQTSSGKVTNVLSSIDEMKNISEKIESIIGVIDEIADKTNLLSINASIESARAGEHGRGFAIVAGEVSKLSEETSVNVKDITSLIRSFRKTIKEGSLRITEVIEFFNEVQGLIVQLSDTTNKIIDSMLAQLEKIMKIQTNVEEASKRADNIKNSVVDQRTEIYQVAESIQKLVKDSKSTSSKSNELLEISFEIQKPAKYIKGLLDHYKF